MTFALIPIFCSLSYQLPQKETFRIKPSRVNIHLMESPQEPKKSVVAVGNFDGVHLGHRRILTITKTKALAHSAIPLVFTFKPHPRMVVRPDLNIKMICSFENRRKKLAGLGFSHLIEQPFTHEFAATEPEEFFQTQLIEKLNAVEIVVGQDFAFGKQRSGTLDGLDKLCRRANIDLTIVEPLLVNDAPVSSTRIRNALQGAKIEEANALLGAPFSYLRKVKNGENRGNALGFPTANIYPEEELILPNGVYATRVRSSKLKYSEKFYPSVTNVGVRPTFQAEGRISIETHILNQSVDLYGSELEVEFLTFIRPEQKFPNVESLREQIRKDCETAYALQI